MGVKFEPWNASAHPNKGKEGYEYLGDNPGAKFYAQNTFKLNIYNYPLFSQVGIVPFFFGTTCFVPSSM